MTLPKGTYECYNHFFAVAYAHKDMCVGPLEVKAQEGYLSSYIAEQNGCGSLDSPWFVTVIPGQHIQFTLHDFGEPLQWRPGQVLWSDFYRQ